MTRVLIAPQVSENASTTPGELLIVGMRCDEPCGCTQSFIGVRSGRLTTTGVVAAANTDRATIMDEVRRSIGDPGRGTDGAPSLAAQQAADITAMIARIADLPVGTVVRIQRSPSGLEFTVEGATSAPSETT